MIPHHTKTKGDLGVLKAQLDLYQKGYMILLPQTEHAPFDLVIYKNGEFKTVQVKYRELSSTGTLNIKFSSSYCNTKGSVVKSVNKELIDLYCIYCPNTDSCYYLLPKDFNLHATLRIAKSKNGQSSGVHSAEDFLEIPSSSVAGCIPSL